MEPGTKLGHYEIIAPLGEGGMGEVYRARDAKLCRDVALKILPSEMAERPDRVQRFEREARAVAALNHPNIVTIHSVEDVGGVHFLTMELVKGEDLSKLIPNGGFALEKFFELAIPIADAISAAHQQGITHRDVKPANIMVGGDGSVKVLDFGLAKLFLDASDPEASRLPTEALTEEGKILGTVAYMSPEQAEGKPVDHRSDIFSLGIVLYEMATGERPFKGDTRVSTVTSILRDEPASVVELNPDAPRHLGRIIKRTLAKEPYRRYQAAMSLRTELEGLQEELIPAPARHEVAGDAPGTAGRQIADTIAAGAAQGAGPIASGEASSDTGIRAGLFRRHRGRLLASAATLGVLFLGVSWALRGADSETPSADRVARRLTAFAGFEYEMDWSPDGGLFAFIHTSRGNADIAAMPTTGGRMIDLAMSPRDELAPRWSPDNRWVAYMMDPGNGMNVYLVPPLGGEARYLTNTNILSLDRHSDWNEGLGASPWSPDGQLFLFPRFDESSGSLAIHRIDVDTTEEEQLTRPVPGTADLSAAWSPDGQWIAFKRRLSGLDREFWLMPAQGGELLLLLDGVQSSTGLAWSADSRSIVFDSNRAGPFNLWEVDIESRNVRQLTSGSGLDLAPAVSATSNIGYANFEHTINLNWMSTGEIDAEHQQLTFDSPGISNVGPRVAPGGTQVVYSSNRTGDFELWLVDRVSRSDTRLTDQVGDDVRPDWSPDGREIVFLSNRGGAYQLWILNAERRSAQRLSEQQAHLWGTETNITQGPLWAPDGETIGYLAPSPDGVELWTISPDGTDRRARLPGVLRFGWYRDSRQIVYTRKAADGPAAVELWVADLEENTKSLLLAADITEIAVAAAGSAVSYVSATSHFTMKLYILELAPPDDSDGLPRAVGEPQLVTPEDVPWHVHNGGWSWDGEAVVYVTDQDEADIWVLEASR